MFNFKIHKKLEGCAETRYSKGCGNYVFSYEFCNAEKVLCKKDVLNDFTKPTGKYLRQSLFVNKVAVAQVFSVNLSKILTISFLTENFRWLLL